MRDDLADRGLAHTDPEMIRDRIEGLEKGKLISLLAPHAWLAVDIHHRLG